MRRALLLTVVATAVAGAVLLLTSGRTWGEVTVGASGGARQHVSVTGHDVAPALSALGLALLAMSVALLAARGPLRRVGGLIVVIIGGAALAGGVRAHNDVGHALALRVFASSAKSLGGSRSVWWLVAAIAGALAVVAGTAAVFGAGRGGGLGAKYDAPSAAPQPADRPVDPWEAIEQGQDPTVGQ
ncbi:MAG: hypothetical protein V7636_2329 [Actinomycetota bacterium]|jgi:uncharacterized membrane protein (TIGR02234 family)